jgi:hypothetical protein
MVMNASFLRKSYHGYPHGFAQLVYSPTVFELEPMQIDSHNRNYTGEGYRPWFFPASVIDTYDPNSDLSPLIECPCTDRIGRVVLNQSAIIMTGTCAAPLTTAADCFAAVQVCTLCMCMCMCSGMCGGPQPGTH